MNTDTEQTMTQDQRMAALFANLVMQHTNMAFIFMGQVPHPETGQTVRELDHARYFIDQLEMLEAKTKGNLSSQEQALLKQSLTNLRMAFVEAVSNPAPAEGQSTSTAAPVAESSEKPVAGETKAEESHKKFSKKY